MGILAPYVLSDKYEKSGHELSWSGRQDTKRKSERILTKSGRLAALIIKYFSVKVFLNGILR